LILISVLAGVANGRAEAGESSYNVGVQSGYTDNVNLDKDKQGDVPTELFTSFQYIEESPATVALIDGRIAYRNYLLNNAADEWRPNVHGNLLWRLDPGRWSWALDGAWQQVRIDQLGPDSPENVQNQAIVWTGPDFRAPLSSVTTVTAEARAGYQYNSQTSDDNASVGAALRLSTRKRNTVQLSGNLQARAVRYTKSGSDPDQPVFSDFNIAEAYVGYSRQDAHIKTLIEIGGSFAQIKDTTDESDLFLRADVSRALSRISKAGIRVSYGFDYEGNSALTRPAAPEVDRPLEASAPGLFYDKRAEFYYERSGKRSTLTATLYARDRDFANDLNDERNYGGGLSLARQISRLTTGRLLATYQRTDFANQSLDYDDYTLRVEVSRRLSRQLAGTVELRHRSRTSSDPSREYDESAFVMSLLYQF